MINGVTVEKEYTIVVNPQEKAGKISYSTLDNQVYLSDEIKEDQIDKIIDLATGDVWYEEGMPTEKMLQNTDKNDLAEVTKKVVVFLEDGSNYSIELVSYTKVLTTSKDFEVFYTTESSGVISGYYIMANDIYLDGTWSGNGVKSTDNPHKFTGVFDGNGHFAEIALKRYGIFGTIVGTSAQRVEIKDAAFIVKQLGVKDFAYASILAYRMNYATVSNCYFEYDLPEGTKIDTGYYGWGQSSGLGIYAHCQVEVRFNNVIIDTSKVETECVTYEQPFSFGSIAIKADSSSGGAYLTRTADVYVISTNKYMSYYADVTASSGKVTAFNGIKYAWFASNDTEAYDACEVTGVKSKLSGTKRYDNYTAFAADEANSFANFGDVWTFSKGYPEFPAVAEYKRLNNINNNTEFYLGGSTEATEATLEIGTDNISINAYASLDGKTYIPTLTTDSAVVSVENGTITAVEMGTAIVTATYDVEGVEFVKTYTIKVSIPVLTAELRYSTMTNELFVEDNKVSLADIRTIANAENNQVVYYADGAVTSDINANYTTNLLFLLLNLLLTMVMNKSFTTLTVNLQAQLLKTTLTKN